MIRFVAALLLVMAHSLAQAAQVIFYLDDGANLKPYAVVQVLPATNDTGETFSFDVAAEYTQALRTALTEKAYTVAADQPVEASHLVLSSSVVSYEPGSAGQRWLLPGSGRTHATIRSTLRDGASGKLIAEVVVADSISAGGLYTIGMDKRILRTFAHLVADELSARRTPGERQQEESQW